MDLPLFMTELASLFPSGVLPYILPLPSLVSSQPPPLSKRTLTCYYCGILRHLGRDCWKKQHVLQRVTLPGTFSHTLTFILTAHSLQSPSLQTFYAPLSPVDLLLQAMIWQFQQSHPWTVSPQLNMRVRLKLLHLLHVVSVLSGVLTLMLLSKCPLISLIFIIPVHHRLSPIFTLLTAYFFLSPLLVISHPVFSLSLLFPMFFIYP